MMVWLEISSGPNFFIIFTKLLCLDDGKANRRLGNLAHGSLPVCVREMPLKLVTSCLGRYSLKPDPRVLREKGLNQKC